jgi:hypothetical protein
MQKPDYIPQDYKRIKVVDSLTELFNEQFGGADEVNAVLMPRRVSENFQALAGILGDRLGIKPDIKAQRSLDREGARNQIKHLDHWERKSLQRILYDMDQLSERDVQPLLRVVSPAGYDFKIAYRLHEDREKPGENGRIMCCYMEPTTEWLRNEDAVRKGGQIYEAKPVTKFFSFRVGDIWKQADCGQKVEPFIHRAIRSEPGSCPRLLLVADRVSVL